MTRPPIPDATIPRRARKKAREGEGKTFTLGQRRKKEHAEVGDVRRKTERYYFLNAIDVDT